MLKGSLLDLFACDTAANEIVYKALINSQSDFVKHPIYELWGFKHQIIKQLPIELGYNDNIDDDNDDKSVCADHSVSKTVTLFNISYDEIDQIILP